MLSFESSGQVEGLVVDKDTMPESGEHNWPGDEFGSFLDRLGAGDDERAGVATDGAAMWGYAGITARVNTKSPNHAVDNDVKSA